MEVVSTWRPEWYVPQQLNEEIVLPTECQTAKPSQMIRHQRHKLHGKTEKLLGSQDWIEGHQLTK